MNSFEGKRAECKIENAGVLFQILDQLPTSIFVKDADLKFEFSNAAHCELIGVPAERLLGSSDADYYPPEQAAQFLARDREVLETGEVLECEELVTGKSGRTALYLTRKSKVVTADGRVHLVGTNTDLSEVKKSEELQRVNDEISRLNGELAAKMRNLKDAQDEIIRNGKMALLGELTATIAHEIRNPLGAVRTAAFLLERKIRGKHLGVEGQLQRINNGIVRCDSIITQLLDFARLRTPQCEEIDVDEWLTALVEEEARRLPAVVKIECMLGLAGRKAEIDIGQMSRAIGNLITNASQAMVGKGDDVSQFRTHDPRIVIETQSTSRGAEISVSDHGPGIPADEMKKIMEPLFTTKSFGTGLGLPAAERILVQHGGGIEVASEPGQGARFTAWFPAEQNREEAA